MDGYSITRARLTADPSPSETIINNWSIEDVKDLGALPYNALMTEEEKEEAYGDDYLVKADIISSLLSFVFAPVKGYIPSPYDVAFRMFILCYAINPAIINNMTLKEIGALFETSKQTASARLVKISNSLNIRARSQKGVETCKRLSDVGKERWQLIKEEERRQYLRDYRAANRERLRIADKEYYAKNREAICKRRAAKREKGRRS